MCGAWERGEVAGCQEDLCRESRDDEFDSFGTGHRDSLLSQCLENLVDEWAGIIVAVVAGSRFHPGLAGRLEPSRPVVAGEQLHHDRPGEVDTKDNAFHGGVDLDQYRS